MGKDDIYQPPSMKIPQTLNLRLSENRNLKTSLIGNSIMHTSNTNSVTIKTIQYVPNLMQSGVKDFQYEDGGLHTQISTRAPGMEPGYSLLTMVGVDRREFLRCVTLHDAMRLRARAGTDSGSRARRARWRKPRSCNARGA